jgi:ZIP family zinc transporter
LGAGSAGLPWRWGPCSTASRSRRFSGLGLAQGQGISIALLVATFVSNLPESIGSSSDMRAAGERPGRVIVLWAVVVAICTLATLVGYAISRITAERFEAAVDGFAAGALLVMLVGPMVAEASEKAHDRAGLAAVLGFAVAAGLSASPNRQLRSENRCGRSAGRDRDLDRRRPTGLPDRRHDHSDRVLGS